MTQRLSERAACVRVRACNLLPVHMPLLSSSPFANAMPTKNDVISVRARNPAKLDRPFEFDFKRLYDAIANHGNAT